MKLAQLILRIMFIKKINNTNNNICINKNSFLPSFINLRPKIKIVE